MPHIEEGVLGVERKREVEKKVALAEDDYSGGRHAIIDNKEI